MRVFFALTYETGKFGPVRGWAGAVELRRTTGIFVIAMTVISRLNELRVGSRGVIDTY